MVAETQNASLHRAKGAKEDEFYTQLEDVERELKHYRKHFKGKVVYCNCDDPRVSAFFHYFSYNFEKLGLKKLIATCYKNHERDLFSTHDSERAIFLEYEGDKNGDRIPGDDEIEVKHLVGDGDFRSAEAIELLKQADIVVTNPPFSLFREFVAQLNMYNKKFIILANQNAITYKEIFPLLQKGKIWVGANSGDMSFRVPDHYTPRATRFWVDEDGQKWRSFGNMCWFTNLDYKKRHEDLTLYKTYTPDEYPKYDNFDAIEVSKVADIPIDYEGVMGVTIGFLTKHNPDQFEIVGITKTWYGGATKIYPQQTQVSTNGKTSQVGKLNDGPVLRVDSPPTEKTYYKVDGECYVQMYARVLIRNKKVEA
ncbi:MAG: adenine-specific methyltransferase EcoRI family protein [Chromatiales bacterium]|nr:adenine-specific methyltransferase EcoRI family protein [Chromatiales bacterium]